jgi:hypothetical protein
MTVRELREELERLPSSLDEAEMLVEQIEECGFEEELLGIKVLNAVEVLLEVAE